MDTDGHGFLNHSLRPSHRSRLNPQCCVIIRSMFRQNLDLTLAARAETLRLCSGISQAQSEFAPHGKWSTGEVLGHLLLTDRLYRTNFVQLIELRKAGRRAVIRDSFSNLNTSIAYIPKPLLPLFEIPFTMIN